jgi:hypothetical protein
MFRVRRVLGLVLSAGLVALALGALGVSSASAATAPAVKVCKKLPAGLTGKGLWLSEACPKTENAKEGTYAWAWAENQGKSTLYCLLGGTLYAESLCESDNKVGPFLEVLTNEAFPKQTGLLLLSVLTGHAAGIATTIHCEDGDFSGQPLTATLSSGITITYLGCTVTNAGCTVNSTGGTAGTIETQKLDGSLESLTLVNFTPEEKSKFVEVEYNGTSCALKEEKLPISGSQMCQWNSGSTEPAILHLLLCKKSESALKLGSEKAEYEGLTHVRFEGSPYWKIW